MRRAEAAWTQCAIMRNVARMTMSDTSGQWRVPTFDKHDRLGKARESAGISQERMAEMLGCSRRTITRYETSGSIPRSVILGYHVATQTDLQWLETGVPGQSPKLPHLDSNQEPIVLRPARFHPRTSVAA